ncbi:MAG: hypothetical protein ACR2L3_06145 [Actinomycetota bacterium]
MPSISRRDSLAWALLEAAAFSVLAMVAAGSLLLMAAKLQYPGFGSGGSTIQALLAAVIAGLGSLGVPIHLGELTASALPVGALILIGWASVWGTAHTLARGATSTLPERVHAGLRLGLWLAPICLILSLGFRISGATPVYADAWGSLLLGGLWGAFFGALGGLVSHSSFRHLWHSVFLLLGRAQESALGLRLAGIVLWSFAALGAAAVLLGVIAALVSGDRTAGFGLGDVVAAAVYVAAFGPNMVMAVVALGAGSSVSVGAQISASGRSLGPSEGFSLLRWPPDGPPALAFGLLLLPILSTLIAGYRARKVALTRSDVFSALRWTVPLVSFALFVGAAMAEARIGGDFLDKRGFARFAPDPWVLAFMGALWTGGGVWLGWWVADRRPGSSSSTGGGR